MKLRSIFSACRRVKVLFFPELCTSCKRKLVEGEHVLCTSCRMDIPLTYEWEYHDNEVFKLFKDRSFLVEEATSFFYYRKGSGFSKAVQNLKFHHQCAVGEELGEWYGRKLKECGLGYDKADAIVPLPLHPSRRRARGYNQSEYIAKGLSAALGVPLDTKSIVRKVKTKPQSRTAVREERWSNTEDAFFVNCPEKLAGRNIILVDDVLTTGATLLSCIRAIEKTGADCRIWIAVLSSSPKRSSR